MDTMGLLDDPAHDDFAFLGFGVVPSTKTSSATAKSSQDRTEPKPPEFKMTIPTTQKWSELDEATGDDGIETPAWQTQMLEGDEEEDETFYNLKDLPQHACRYCGYHDPLGVVRCNTCKKWFCNNRGCSSGSHAVSHLVRSKHKEVSLHPDGPLGDSVLECYVCGSRNIFMLGFVPSKQESVVVLLCREPCLNSKTLLDMDWDPVAWLPLIEDRQLLSWLVAVPKPRQTRRCRTITTSQIAKLEELWKTNPDADLEDMQGAQIDDALPEIPMHFQDGFSYMDCFTPILDCEESYAKHLKEAISHDNITIQWDIGLNDKKLAIFAFPVETSKISPGDEVRISHKGSHWEGSATLVKIDRLPNAGDSLVCEMKASGNVPIQTTTGFAAMFVWNGVGYKRMKAAMKAMALEDTSLSAYLYNALLGHTPAERHMKIAVPSNVNAPRLAQLNYSQQQALRTALVSPLTLIQGPPGTGKTVTSATLVYHLCKINKAQILVCAPSNVACDHLTQCIEQTGLNVIRVAAKSRESMDSPVKHLMLHDQIRQFCKNSPAHSELNKLFKLRALIGDLAERDRQQFFKLLRSTEMDLLAAADVICCTCTAAGDGRLHEFRFKHVVIDEATQAMEPEALIPIVMGAKQVVLVGDHCQMGPIVLKREAETAGLGRSLFERLLLLGIRPIRLDIQYRMHPCLSEFSSNNFYEGSLQNGVSAEERDSRRFFPWPSDRKPMFFYNSIGAEEIGPNATSFLNRVEAAMAEKFLTEMIKRGVSPSTIGVITPYEAQRCYLLNYIEHNGPLSQDQYKLVEIASVDSFQGREKEIVILTCVRSSDHQGIGFLHSWRRLNVALTRARSGLVLIGNSRVLSRHMLWHALISHFKAADLIVDGPVNNLRPINIALPKPRQTGHAIGPAAVQMYHSSIIADEINSVPMSVNAPYVPGAPPVRHFSTAAGVPASQASMSGYSQSQD